MAIPEPTFCVNLTIADPCPTDGVTWEITRVLGTWAGAGKPAVNGIPLAAPSGRIEDNEAPTVTVDGNCLMVQTCRLYANLGDDQSVGGSYNYTLFLESSDGQSLQCNLPFSIDAATPYTLEAGCIPFDQVSAAPGGSVPPVGAGFDEAVKAIAQDCADAAIATATGAKGGEIHPPEWAGAVEATRAISSGDIALAPGSLGPLRTLRLVNPGPCEACAVIDIDWGEYWIGAQRRGRLWIDSLYSIAINAPAPAPNLFGSLEGRQSWLDDAVGTNNAFFGMHSMGQRELIATIPAGGFVEVAWQGRLHQTIAPVGEFPDPIRIFNMNGTIKGTSNGQ